MVEIRKSCFSEPLKSLGQRREPHGASGRGHVPFGQKSFLEACDGLELCAFVCGITALGQGRWEAVSSVISSLLQQAGQGQDSAPCFGDFVRSCPTRYHASHGQRSQWATTWNVLMIAEVLIEGAAGQACRRAASIDADGRAAAVANQPEIVAAKAVHMRIDDGNDRRCSDDSFDSIAAVTQDAESSFGGQMMRSDYHAPPSAGGFHLHSKNPSKVRHKLVRTGDGLH